MYFVYFSHNLAKLSNVLTVLPVCILILAIIPVEIRKFVNLNRVWSMVCLLHKTLKYNHVVETHRIKQQVIDLLNLNLFNFHTNLNSLRLFLLNLLQTSPIW